MHSSSSRQPSLPVQQMRRPGHAVSDVETGHLYLGDRRVLMLERTVGALQQENRLAKKAIFDLQTETGWLLRELDAKADEEHTRFLNFRVAHTISLALHRRYIDVLEREVWIELGDRVYKEWCESSYHFLPYLRATGRSEGFDKEYEIAKRMLGAHVWHYLNVFEDERRHYSHRISHLPLTVTTREEVIGRVETLMIRPSLRLFPEDLEHILEITDFALL